ncbi:hypothetical protein [Acidimangrovimonas sediminis]|uniref:hypothetical protein n=1 Tax=Acidimangrovimonas sediminis TaxID=2056283 RepID=UPI000C80593F|nr:hypothetical protein [Acidimangrovimonas sediminis]
MIVSDRWIWLHVPKCAGTATEKILHAAFEDDPEVVFDAVAPGLPVIWHDGLADRAARVEGFAPRGRAVVANIRRLPLWLLSRVHFEVQRYGPEAIVRREVLVSGRFRPVPLGVPKPLRRADDELARYLPGVTHWLRTEHLAEDIPAAFGITVPRRRARDRVNATTLEYIKDPGFWFTAAELRALYAANPLWAELEARVYGDHLTVPEDSAPRKHGVYKSDASV